MVQESVFSQQGICIDTNLKNPIGFLGNGDLRFYHKGEDQPVQLNNDPFFERIYEYPNVLLCSRRSIGKNQYVYLIKERRWLESGNYHDKFVFSEYARVISADEKYFLFSMSGFYDHINKKWMHISLTSGCYELKEFQYRGRSALLIDDGGHCVSRNRSYLYFFDNGGGFLTVPIPKNYTHDNKKHLYHFSLIRENYVVVSYSMETFSYAEAIWEFDKKGAGAYKVNTSEYPESFVIKGRELKEYLLITPYSRHSQSRDYEGPFTVVNAKSLFTESVQFPDQTTADIVYDPFVSYDYENHRYEMMVAKSIKEKRTLALH